MKTISELITECGGLPHGVTDSSEWLDFEEQPIFVSEYLKMLVPHTTIAASGLRVIGVDALTDEHHPRAVPGGIIRPFGFCVIATTVGGNAIAFGIDGNVYWADRSSFSTYGKVYVQDKVSRQWDEHPVDSSSIRKALGLLGTDQKLFLQQLLNNELEDYLDRLDDGD